MPDPSPTSPRQDWMSVFARAPAARLAQLMGDLPEHAVLRAPEIGTIMLEGRIGGTGGRFNLGEMTVTRCSVRVGDVVGHACLQGRDKDHARRAALLDALMQGGDAPRIDDTILTPLRAEAGARATARREKAAATRVEFFTMMRGDV